MTVSPRYRRSYGKIGDCEQSMTAFSGWFWGSNSSKINPLEESHSIIQIYFAEPGPPSHVRAVPVSKETIRVLWDPPLEPNGIIRAYRLHYSKAVKDPLAINSDKVSIVRLAANTTSKYLPDLESLTEYYFWVIASTSIGFGNASAVVTQTTQEQSKIIVHLFTDTSGDCVCL